MKNKNTRIFNEPKLIWLLTGLSILRAEHSCKMNSNYGNMLVFFNFTWILLLWSVGGCECVCMCVNKINIIYFFHRNDKPITIPWGISLCGFPKGIHIQSNQSDYSAEKKPFSRNESPLKWKSMWRWQCKSNE